MLSADTACSKNRMFIRQLMPLEYVFASLLDLDASLVAKYNGLFQLEPAPIDPSMQRLVRTAPSPAIRMGGHRSLCRNERGYTRS